MNWTQIAYSLINDWRAEALWTSRAWLAAYACGDSALLSNLHCNAMNPAGVCMALDSAGVPVGDPDLRVLADLK